MRTSDTDPPLAPPFRPGPEDDPVELRRLTQSGYLRAVLADVLAPAEEPETIGGRAAAAQLLLPPRLRQANAVVAFASAAWLLTGWRIAGQPPAELELIISPQQSRASSSHLRLRQVRLGNSDALRLPGGCLVTTPVRTAADVARDLPAPLAETALVALHRAYGVDPEAVRHALEGMSGARGVHRAAAVVDSWAEGPYAVAG